MGMKLVKSIDDGEIYLLPDKTEAEKNTPPFMNDVSAKFDKNKSYAENVMIADLTEQLNIKDKQLKNARKEVVIVDKTLMIGFGILGIVIILIATFAFSFLRNDMLIPQNLSEQAVTAEIPTAEIIANDETETKENFSDDTNSVYDDEPKEQKTGLNENIDFINEITNFLGNRVIKIFIVFVFVMLSLKFAISILRKMGS
ncbi:MAG: hypothetical protein J1F60_02240 [Oscillospiraceae bacterium]|nr:hypothetical protein [Oscillospiraceae bacterium]